ncbi:YihY family inner membrane protein [Granulicatella sp. zg-ZJ]|uniref:YihY/virulence factor BrkB family protein n=1 Tax=unclassified Granulicatella TaxID=2630493 RepID=UPI0013BEE746|nr:MULTISPECIES: YihY/virulence factor BrkB family protein [unclassified Granulicatella]MBS4749864.1 YihY/virulence factor BrkB family protein [Carnobacteriaceae bacterium zg-ZUI78]NEW63050.1 YihY family inner membrane protein [Granulicatella sp. zg-ZJ]NEW66945.1 YihY family inner membrane protein [Granulicatella sp. zg-84]QMI85959.1 YihY/virulence factor BrkB family protein [Carnobacteriaceae bacterium zg-84]
MLKKLRVFKQAVSFNMKRVDIGSQAAQLTFYILLSLVPIILVIGNIIPLLPISYDSVKEYLDTFLPESIRELVDTMLQHYLHSYSGSSLFLGIIVALWSSSQAFNVIQKVLNDIYHTKERKNFLVSRLFAFFMSLMFVIIIMLVGLMFAYGGTILRLLQQFTIIRGGMDVIFDNFKWIVAFSIIFILLWVMYYAVPNVKWKMRYALPGAVFSTTSILLASQLYSIYIGNATNNALTDGTIGVFIVLMLWLYVVSMVILFGAWLNVLYHDYKYMPFLKKAQYEQKHIKEVYYSKDFENVDEGVL